MTTEQRLAAIVDTPIQIKQVLINGRTINYAVAGSGSPLLLIHGANFGWGVWYTNIAEFARYFTVYGIDLPGAGRSSRIDYASLDPEKDLFEVAEHFLDLLHLSKLHIVGCSIGGWLALRLALQYPSRIEKVIIENAVGFANYMNTADKIIGFYPLAKLITKTLIRPQNSRSVEKFLRKIFYNKKIILRQEFLDYFQETMLSSHNLLFISRLTALSSQFNIEHQLPNIPHKTLVIWGKEDRIIPLKKNINNFHLLPNATVQLIEKAGHIPSLEQPEVFNRISKEFLLS